MYVNVMTSFLSDLEVWDILLSCCILISCYFRLHKMIMINAPWYFSAIWALVSFCVDPVTAEKISIVGSDYTAVLQDLIDEDNIPVEMGGKANVVWHYPYQEGSGCSPDELKAYLEYQEAKEKQKSGVESSS